MTLLRKAALFCDGCGTRLDLDPDIAANLRFGGVCASDEVAGWRELSSGEHLCPKCNREYSEKEKEFANQLAGMVGRHGITFEL